jgi:CTD nuclear envelope phosphatase 1
MPSRRHRYLTPFIDYLALIYAYIRTMLSIPLRTQQRIAIGKTTATSTPPKAQSSPNSNSTKRTALQYYKGKTVVLDLDETLVHSVQLSGGKLQTVHAAIQRKQIEVQSNKQSILYLVYKRPHADFFLKTVRMCDRIDNDNRMLRYVLDKPMVQGGHLYSINGRICRPGDRLA